MSDPFTSSTFPIDKGVTSLFNHPATCRRFTRSLPNHSFAGFHIASSDPCWCRSLLRYRCRSLLRYRCHSLLDDGFRLATLEESLMTGRPDDTYFITLRVRATNHMERATTATLPHSFRGN